MNDVSMADLCVNVVRSSSTLLLRCFGVLICTWCFVFGVSESTRGRKSKVRGETCDEVSYVVMWHVCELGECGQL